MTDNEKIVSRIKEIISRYDSNTNCRIGAYDNKTGEPVPADKEFVVLGCFGEIVIELQKFLNKNVDEDAIIFLHNVSAESGKEVAHICWGEGLYDKIFGGD